MTLEVNQNPTIIRTERGLTVSGTRITLYDVMEYIKAQYPPKFVRSLFDLTEEQMNTALAYIEKNQAEVEAEYQVVLQQAKETRQYWEERNRAHFARIAAMPPSPDKNVLRAKLEAQKAQHELEV
ncbi:MAG: DUF433 domain-containing protein [Thainema sp.]